MMRKFFLAFAVLSCSSGLCLATFAIFQTATVGTIPAVTSCDITTGSCTGQGAGTGLFTAATCDGVADDASAFNSFNTWAQASTTNVNGQMLELFVPSGKLCRWTSGNVNVNKVMTGIKNGRISGYGATFQNPSGNGFRLGPGSQPGGICQKGLDDAAGCSARIASVSAGATSVTVTTTGFSGSLSTLCARFVAGRWLAVTGFDLQGVYQAAFGEPPNPHFLEFVQINSTANCATTGQITLVTPLVNAYLSTWPNFSSGASNGSDKGGPATIYALVSDWGGAIEVQGLTIDSPVDQTIAQGRSMTFRDITMTGSSCVIPSQNDTFTMINSTGTSCAIEVDKIINTLTYSGTTLRRLAFQSSSTNTLTWDGGALTLDLNGTPKVANISNVTLPTLKLGPYAYGAAKSATCTKCVISNDITALGGITEDGHFGGAIPFYTVSGGVWSYPITQNVLGVADNGSGKARLTVASTTGWITGATSGQSSLWSGCTVPGGCAGGLVLTVIDATHIDIQYNFAQVTWSGTGFIANSAEQERWAIPGTNVLPGAFLGYGAPAFQVTGTTTSGGFINIATTLPGGYPTMPQNGATTANITVQMPSWRCINCSGSVQATNDWNLATSARPLYSYINRTWSNSTTLTTLKAIGKTNSIKINVTDAYAGATNPMRFNMSGFAYAPNTTVLGSISWVINLRQAGLRTITPSGVTCDTGGGPVGGACSGDTILSDPAQFFNGDGISLSEPNGSPVDDTWSMNAEFDLDQGVVP